MKNKKKDKLKDPNKPKRPMSSFLLFFEEEFKKTLTEKHLAAKCKAAGDKWKCMSEAEKAPYVAKANEMMAEYKKNMQAYKNGRMESSIDQEVHDIIDDDDDDNEDDNESLNNIIPPPPKKRKSPPPSTSTKKTCTEGPTHQVAENTFLKFKEAIIKDYLASNEFDEIKSECAGKAIQHYKASSDHKKLLVQHLQRYKNSEDYQKALTQHLEMHKESEKYKKELAEHLERYKKSEDYEKALSEHLEMHKKSGTYKKELAEHL